MSFVSRIRRFRVERLRRKAEALRTSALTLIANVRALRDRAALIDLKADRIERSIPRDGGASNACDQH